MGSSPVAIALGEEMSCEYSISSIYQQFSNIIFRRITVARFI